MCTKKYFNILVVFAPLCIRLKQNVLKLYSRVYKMYAYSAQTCLKCAPEYVIFCSMVRQIEAMHTVCLCLCLFPK